MISDQDFLTYQELEESSSRDLIVDDLTDAFKEFKSDQKYKNGIITSFEDNQGFEASTQIPKHLNLDQQSTEKQEFLLNDLGEFKSEFLSNKDNSYYQPKQQIEKQQIDGLEIRENKEQHASYQNSLQSSNRDLQMNDLINSDNSMSDTSEDSESSQIQQFMNFASIDFKEYSHNATILFASHIIQKQEEVIWAANSIINSMWPTQ